jgi:G3E family GTPase
VTTVPLWLVAGFLGSGKTTLLRRIVGATPERRLVFLVNEFSAVDVDASLIQKDGGDVIGIPGGSIFCRCLVTEFVDVLGRVHARVAADGRPVDGVVVEASGMADPRSLGRMLAESRLDRQFHVAGVIVTIDPGSFLKLLLVLPNIRGQVESADLLLLNKADLHDDRALARAEELVRKINPAAGILRCVECDVPLDLVLAADRPSRVARLDAEYARCRDPHFRTEAVSLAQVIDLPAFAAGVRDCADELFRLKGHVQAPDGVRHLDLSSGVLRDAPADASAETALVFIWSGQAATGHVEALIRRLRAGAFAVGGA